MLAGALCPGSGMCCVHPGTMLRMGTPCCLPYWHMPCAQGIVYAFGLGARHPWCTLPPPAKVVVFSNLLSCSPSACFQILPVQWVPYAIKGSSWEAEEEGYVRHLLGLLDRFAPGGDEIATIASAGRQLIMLVAWLCN